MTERNCPYEVGDAVQFENATLVANRSRDYKITEVHPDGIGITAKGHPYFLTHQQAEQLGIVKVTKERQ